MMPAVNLHPQRRRLNQPLAAAISVALSRKNKGPTVLPMGASRIYADRFIAQSLSRAVPGHTSVVPARIAIKAPKAKKSPTAVIARGEAVRTGAAEHTC